jgi:eukaryotic-like serine/threonine-protein kinase
MAVCPRDGAKLVDEDAVSPKLRTQLGRPAKDQGKKRWPSDPDDVATTPKTLVWEEPTDASLEPGLAFASAPPDEGPTPPAAGAVVTLPTLAAQPARRIFEDIRIPSGELAIGTRVGEYEVVSKLGEGGMGMVFGGIQPVIGKKVAIKVLGPHHAGNPETVRRFVTEARAVNQIGHRNIVDIFSFGELPDGRHYFVMEWLEGETLSKRLKRLKVLRFDEGIGIVQQICAALEAAHGKGIVHRDLKPDNIHLTGDSAPFVKILDFGIAKLTGPESPVSSTRSGVPMGTPLYMSPEQCRGVGVDYRTDIYALGVMLYEMFGGRTPFQAQTFLEIVNGHVYHTPPPLADFAQVPAVIERVIAKAMAKQPDERYQSAADLAAALALLADDLDIEAPVVRAKSRAAGAQQQDAPAAPAMRTPKEPPSGTVNPDEARPPAVAAEAAPLPLSGLRRRWTMWLALGALVVAGGVGVTALRGRPATRTAPAPTPAAPAGAPSTPPSRAVEAAGGATMAPASAPALPSAAKAIPAVTSRAVSRTPVIGAPTARRSVPAPVAAPTNAARRLHAPERSVPAPPAKVAPPKPALANTPAVKVAPPKPTSPKPAVPKPASPKKDDDLSRELR